MKQLLQMQWMETRMAVGGNLSLILNDVSITIETIEIVSIFLQMLLHVSAKLEQKQMVQIYHIAIINYRSYIPFIHSLQNISISVMVMIIRLPTQIR